MSDWKIFFFHKRIWAKELINVGLSSLAQYKFKSLYYNFSTCLFSRVMVTIYPDDRMK